MKCIFLKQLRIAYEAVDESANLNPTEKFHTTIWVPFVKRFALCHWTVRCLSCPSCLSATLVYSLYCGQTDGWIKMKLGTDVGLGPGHIVLDEDRAGPAPPLPKGHIPTFRPMSIVAKRSPISATAENLSWL